jgi:hypothetical protein
MLQRFNAGDAMQVQKELLLTPQLTKGFKRMRGELKLINIASLLKQKSFLSRLSTKSRRGPAKYEPLVMANPLGQMPEQTKQQDQKASSLPPRCLQCCTQSNMPTSLHNPAVVSGMHATLPSS